jgi:Flp pilus assembly protein TadG
MRSLLRGVTNAARRVARPLRRFGRRQEGATAVEFAIVATPFFAMMFAILETALVFFSQQTLDTAVANAARLIRTGQAQQQGFSANQFKTQICSLMDLLLNCATGLQLDVRTYPTFDSIDLADPLDGDGNINPAGFTYDPGNGSDIVVVRAFYAWPSFTNLLGFDISNMGGGQRLLASAAAFRNEPFPW